LRFFLAWHQTHVTMLIRAAATGQRQLISGQPETETEINQGQVLREGLLNL